MSCHSLFKDRHDAAQQLAQRLQSLRLHHPLILAIPRGAVPMAYMLAERLGGELDVVLVRKLGAPCNPEYAIGAVDERGHSEVAPDFPRTDANLAWIARETREQLALLRRRRASYGGARPPADPCGRNVVIVDDGLATGATMAAALRAVRTMLPLRLVAAVPVAAPEALQRVRPLADDIVCLHAPPDFGAVSRHYDTFPQIEEEEVIGILRTSFAQQTSVSQND
ncbi:MAG: phosphoribosyltransferase family protein [Pseudomonadota bacterium]